MIRIYTDEAIDRKLSQHRIALTAQLAEAVEALLPDDCGHRDRPSCPKCSARRTVRIAAYVVRETGGLKP